MAGIDKNVDEQVWRASVSWRLANVIGGPRAAPAETSHVVAACRAIASDHRPSGVPGRLPEAGTSRLGEPLSTMLSIAAPAGSANFLPRKAVQRIEEIVTNEEKRQGIAVHHLSFNGGVASLHLALMERVYSTAPELFRDNTARRAAVLGITQVWGSIRESGTMENPPPELDGMLVSLTRLLLDPLAKSHVAATGPEAHENSWNHVTAALWHGARLIPVTLPELLRRDAVEWARDVRDHLSRSGSAARPLPSIDPQDLERNRRIAAVLPMPLLQEIVKDHVTRQNSISQLSERRQTDFVGTGRLPADRDLSHSGENPEALVYMDEAEDSPGHSRTIH